VEGAKTNRGHWNDIYRAAPRMRLPSRLNISTRNLQNLLRRDIRRGMRVLEVGFAPGKHLVWVAKVLGADVSGLDYSEPGVANAKRLFDVLGAHGDLRCGDVFETDFAPGSFDLVYSAGLIEHFDDPTEIVRRHVLLAKPAGGVALLIIPNYRGIYGTVQARFDRPNLAIHNLEIMSRDGLERLVPRDLAREFLTRPVGRFDPWLINFRTKWPAPIALSAWLVGNAIGLLQPFEISRLHPWLVLRIVRA
jgi:SAM-dependent methyltransferase